MWISYQKILISTASKAGKFKNIGLLIPSRSLVELKSEYCIASKIPRSKQEPEITFLKTENKGNTHKRKTKIQRWQKIKDSIIINIYQINSSLEERIKIWIGLKSQITKCFFKEMSKVKEL